VVYVTALDLNGLSTEPPKVRKAFKCTCAFQVRDNVSITIHVWQLVPKDHMGAALKQYKGEHQVSQWDR
jgi:hypothetical protein